MIELEVRNFQSIEHEKICIDGFTALVGRSNIGKSALVRAVKSALTGATGTAFVRHGPGCLRRIKSSKTCECYCSVHLVTEGFDLLWEKGDKRNRYVFNGAPFEVPDRGTPDFLQRPKLDPDFGKVKIGEQWKLLQIADQFVDTIFLLDQTGGVTADVFSDVARLDRVNVAIRFVEKDRKDSVSTRKVRDADVLTYGRQLAAYDTLDRDVQGVEAAESGLTKVEGAVERVTLLEKYISELKDIGYRVDQLETACRVAIPDPKPMADKLQRHAKISRLAQAAHERGAAIKRLMGVETVAEPSAAPLVTAAERHSLMVGWSARLQSLQELLGRFKGVSEATVPDPTPLRAAYTRAGAVLRFAAEYDRLTKTIERLEAETVKVASEEQVVRDERSSLDKYMCPTCQQVMPSTHSHETKDAELRLQN